MQKRIYKKADGRDLLLYGHQLHALDPNEEGDGGEAPHTYLRWHPLRQEWIIYAPKRQNRTYKPPAAYCPLCPTHAGKHPTEIPFDSFEIAVFENKFSSLGLNPITPPELPVITGKGTGKCEVVVFTANHSGNIGELSEENVELLLRVWADRYQELLEEPEIQCVMPFENRGEEVGVTLHHPHGQIYSYGFIPPVFEKEAAAFRKEPVLQNLMSAMGDAYTILEDDYTHVFVPPYSRYPYESWITTKSFHPGPWTFSDVEFKSFAKCLKRMVATYDKLYQRQFPYLMILHAAPKGEEGTFQFHIEFYPPMRSSDKMKYLAGTEMGAGTFAVDVMPEAAATELREALI